MVKLFDCIPYFIPDPDKLSKEIPSKANIWYDIWEPDCSLAGWHWDNPSGGTYPIYP